MSDVEKNVEDLSNEETPVQEMPPASLLGHISQLAMQTLVYLGHIPHPVDQETVVDMGQAKYLMDILEILKSKTEANATDEEKEAFGQIMYDLRVKFVEASQQDQASS